MKLLLSWCLMVLCSLVVTAQTELETSGNGQVGGIPGLEDDDLDAVGVDGSGTPDSGFESSGMTPVKQNASSVAAGTTTVTTSKAPPTARPIPSKAGSYSKSTAGQTTRQTASTRGNVEVAISKTTTALNIFDIRDNVDSRDNSVPQPSAAPAQTNESGPLDFIVKHPGILAGLIGGSILGVLFAILLVLFIIYRMKQRSDRTYYGKSNGTSGDDTFWLDDDDAIAVSKASGERYATVRGSDLNQMGAQVYGSSMPPAYSPLVGQAALGTDENWMDNLYNQQLYGQHNSVKKV